MKLLVNTPTGQQELIEIGEGGNYFDESRVIWDERKDGAMPNIMPGGLVRNQDMLAYDATLFAQQTALILPNSKAEFIKSIDAATDFINAAVIGGRAQEYELSEKHAQAYKDAGYTGTVPSSVSSWATAKSWTATQAADDILLTATGWRQAQSAIRANRLLCKENARNAASIEALNTVKAQWAGFLAAIKPSLGL